MTNPYLYAVIALFSLAAMGIVHKLGDRYRTEPLPLTLYAMITAGVLSSIRALGTHTLVSHPPPPQILLVALPFGASAALGLWLFQKGLRYGHIATSWLLVNLSAGIPTVLSIVFYHEHLGWKKSSILLLIVISLLLLWWDRRGQTGPTRDASSYASTEVV
jgi:drug/metabolite transporter (DMT)-like permease